MKYVILLLTLLLAGCTTTGDWNEDTIFYSPKKGDRRLAAMEANLRSIEHQDEVAHAESRRLQGSVTAAENARARDRAEAERLREEVSELEVELTQAKRKLAQARVANEPNATELAELQGKIIDLRSSISRKRVRLNEIIPRR